MFYTKSLLCFKIIWLLCFSYFLDSYTQDIPDSLYALKRFNWERYKMAQEDTQQAYAYFKKGASHFLSKGDTINHLNCIAHLSDIKHRRGKFNEAFDILWEALPMADSIENKLPLLEIHQMLGILYQVYGKNSIALQHTLQGLEIAKEYTQKDNRFED